MSNTIADSINPNQDNILDLQKLIQSDSDTSVSSSSDSPILNVELPPMPIQPMPFIRDSPQIPQYMNLQQNVEPQMQNWFHNGMNHFQIPKNDIEQTLYSRNPMDDRSIPQNIRIQNGMGKFDKIQEINTHLEKKVLINSTSEEIEKIIKDTKQNTNEKVETDEKDQETLISSILGGYITIKGIAISNTTILIAIIFIFIVGVYIWWSSKKERIEKEKEKKREPLVTYNQQQRM